MKNLFYFFNLFFLKILLTKKLLSFLLLSFLLLPQYACNTTEPTKQKLELSFEDASCTEVWLKVTGEIGSEITLNRDNKEVQKFTLSSSPETIRNDSLNPNTTYKYQISGNGETSTTEAATLDTTGNSFTWQTWSFGGDIGFSSLYDVAMIDENDIWAVGEIKIADTSEIGYALYNAMHWDGSKWEFKKMFFPIVCGLNDSITYPAEAILVFNKNEFWISSTGDKIAITKNGIQTNKFCIPSSLSMSINRIWGINSDDVYVVGNSGSMAHYQNGVWTKIETGTDLQFTDIYGAEDRVTGKEEILAVCSRNYPLGKGIYKIEGSTAKEISSNTPAYQDTEIDGIWFIPNRHYYFVGDGIYEKKTLDDKEWTGRPLEISRYSKTAIRGNALNDIYCVGAFGEVLHFNGMRWKSFMNETGWFDGAYGRLDVKGDVFVAVGGEGNQAKILMGKKN